MQTIATAGVQIPAIGFGTWRLKGDACREQVEQALRLGYRHLDTAALYDNEREVGEGLRASGVSRREVFVTTKVWRDSLREDDVLRSAEASLRRLGLDQIDLFLIHWPNRDVPLKETVRGLSRVEREGMTRAIGVSNFNTALLEEAVARADAPIAMNQVEYHPYLSQARLLETQRRLMVPLTAYCPLAEGRVLDDPALQVLADAKGVTVAQLTLRWLVQQGDVAAIPKSADPERAAQNLDVFGFELTDEEMRAVAGLARPDGRVIDSDWVDWD